MLQKSGKDVQLDIARRNGRMNKAWSDLCEAYEGQGECAAVDGIIFFTAILGIVWVAGWW